MLPAQSLSSIFLQKYGIENQANWFVPLRKIHRNSIRLYKQRLSQWLVQESRVEWSAKSIYS